MRVRKRFLQIRHKRCDRGFVLVFFASTLLVLVAMAGFSVDLGHWYLTQARLQRAADAAALAGAPYLPGDLDKAKQVALGTLASNGYPQPGDSVTIDKSPNNPIALDVKFHLVVNNYFISLLDLGLKQTTIGVESTGIYRGAMPMGSPSNVLGNEPPGMGTWNNDPTPQGDWLVINGHQETKMNGDRWSGICSDPQNEPNANQIYGCSGMTNTEAQPYKTYKIRIPKDTTGNVVIQAFDAPFVPTSTENDDDCTGNNVGGAVGLQQPGEPANLYSPSITNPYCTNDLLIYDSDKPSDTTFSVMTPPAPDGTTTALPGCTTTFPGYNADIPTLITNPPAGFAATSAGFRHWYTLCTIPIGGVFQPGDYQLRVSNDAAGNGDNQFSLRAAVLNANGTVNTTETTGINVFADGRLVVNAYISGSSSSFYLVKLPSSQAGQTMTIELYDVGDADDPVTVKILAPPDATAGGAPMTTFPACKIDGPLPTQQTSTISSTCTISGLDYDTYNGQLLRITVNVPQDYQCNDQDPLGCWVKVNLGTSSGLTWDTTSWMVKMDSSPVRLIPNS